MINQNLYPKLGFEPAKFEPIIVIAQVPNALIVNPNNIKAANLSELVDYLQKNPDKVTSATQGNGTTSHLTSELFQLMAKVKLRHIPYRGSAPALQGLLAGDVDLMFDNLGVSLPLVNSGKLKLLAVASAKRLPALPDSPVDRGDVARFRSGRLVWHRRATEDPKRRCREDQRRCERSPAAARGERSPRQAVCREPFGGSVDKTSSYMREEVDRWAAVIKAANIELQ